MNSTNTVNGFNDISQSQAARVAGFGLLFMFISGIYATGPETTKAINEIIASKDRCYPLQQIVEVHRYVDKGHKKGSEVITLEYEKAIITI